MRKLSTGHVQTQCPGRRLRRQTPGASLGVLAVVLVAAVALALAGAPSAAAVIGGPNGKIVFTSGRNDGLTPFDDNHAQLWVAARAGATPVRVTNASIQHRHASWSPDRTKLVYSAGVAGGDLDIYILDLTRPLSTTNPTDITPVPGVVDDRPSWSPDGTRIAYQSKNGANPTQIVIQSVADGSQTILTQPVTAGAAGKPVWSADSKTIYYSLVVSTAPTNDDIYKQAADGSGVATPVVTGTTDDYQPALSPDGQSLCYTSGLFGDPTAKVMRSTITGTNVTTIANSGLGDYNCAWSPDGTKITYVQGIFGMGDLMVKNSGGTGTPTALVPNVPGRFDGNPEWTRNPSPMCQGQTVTVGFNVRATIALSCVDPAPENDPIQRSIVTPPRHGSLGRINQNAIVYTPAKNFSGTDQFTFKANDGTSDSNLATVRVTVARDTPATISSLAVSPSRWRLGSRLPQISAKRAPLGTTVSFRLSKAATVKLTFARTTSGRKVGRRCVAPRPSNRSRRRCTRASVVGQLSVNADAGVTHIRFQGQLSRTRRLTVGTYRLAVGATDSAGTPSRLRTAGFTIVTR